MDFAQRQRGVGDVFEHMIANFPHSTNGIVRSTASQRPFLTDDAGPTASVLTCILRERAPILRKNRVIPNGKRRVFRSAIGEPAAAGDADAPPQSGHCAGNDGVLRRSLSALVNTAAARYNAARHSCRPTCKSPPRLAP